MKLSSKMLQNLPYFWNKKTPKFFFHFEQLLINPKLKHKPGHPLLKIQSFSNWEKKLFGSSYSKNMANFEAFCQTISSSINLLFLKSV